MEHDVFSIYLSPKSHCSRAEESDINQTRVELSMPPLLAPPYIIYFLFQALKIPSQADQQKKRTPHRLQNLKHRRL
jgi:hypothetical protein